jgi:predicted ATPase/class 3 adenylate cyclase
MTLFFSDIEGSTRLLRRAGDRYSDLLRRYREIVRDAIAVSGGEEQGTEGDSFFVVFELPSAACAAALAIQRHLAAEPWPAECEVRIRVGIHAGPIEYRDSWVGLPIHEAARIGAAAHGGQTVVSEAVQSLAGDDLPDAAVFASLGRYRLKDLEHPVRLYQLNHPDLEVEFPPLRAVNELAHNLPLQASTFVGRERELSKLRQLVTTSRLVTLTGAGGSGKTRLALELGASLLDGSGDGVWLVELEPLSDPGSVPSAVANVVGVREDPSRPTLGTLVDAMNDRSMLLILDNCEHVIAAVAQLADALVRSCAGVVVVATSREALGIDGEQVYRVPSLTVPGGEVEDPDVIGAYESVRLLVERAGQHNAGFVLDEEGSIVAARVCRRLDGIPLAIELAAARLRSLSLRDLERRLDERFQILTGGSRLALPRHKTLRALIDWSWHLLTPSEQMVLARLSVFAGGVDLAAAEAVCGGQQGENVLDLLDALVDKSLVQASDSTDTVRYRLLETVRQYAAERLVAGGGEVQRTQVAHRDYYLSLAEEAQPHLISHDQVAWFNRLDVEHENISVALSHGLDTDPVPGLRLATALRTFWKARGHASEGVEAIRAALQRMPEDAPPMLRGEGLAALSYLLEQVGGYQEATTRGQEAWAIAQDLKDQRLAADTLDVRAFVAVRQGNPDTAVPLAEEGLAIARDIADDHLIARLLAVRALARDVLGDHDAAAADTEESVSLYRRVGDQRQVGTMLGNLGYCELSLGNISSARRHLAESLRIARELDDPYGVIYETFNLGIAAYLGEDDDEAEALFTESLSTSRRSVVKASIAYALVGLGLTKSRSGKEHLAAVLHGAAEALFEVLGEAMEPLEAQLRDRDVAKLQAGLGAGTFAGATKEGREMALDELMAIALA